MDWTGGVRKRFIGRRKLDLTLQRQKAYFARQRAKSHRKSSDVHEADFYPARPLSKLSDEQIMSVQTTQGPLNSRRCLQVNKRNSTHRVLRPVEPQYETDQISNTKPSCGNTPQIPSHNDGNLFSHRRQQLLARSDWLNLSVLKPVQVKFPRNRSRENIGRRRKVTRLFDQRQTPFRQHKIMVASDKFRESGDYLMTGALPHEDVEVRVGTQAFASQTQPNNRSQSPANTSMRPPSTSLGPISEESMLLGEDEDLFEAQPIQSSLADIPANLKLHSSQGSLLRMYDASDIQKSCVLDPARSSREQGLFVSPLNIDRNNEQHDSTRRMYPFAEISGSDPPSSPEIKSIARRLLNFSASPDPLQSSNLYKNRFSSKPIINAIGKQSYFLGTSFAERQLQRFPPGEETRHFSLSKKASIDKPDMVDNSDDLMWREFMLSNRRTDSVPSTAQTVRSSQQNDYRSSPIGHISRCAHQTTSQQATAGDTSSSPLTIFRPDVSRSPQLVLSSSPGRCRGTSVEVNAESSSAGSFVSTEG